MKHVIQMHDTGTPGRTALAKHLAFVWHVAPEEKNGGGEGLATPIYIS
jgi:hypothetical protein